MRLRYATFEQLSHEYPAYPAVSQVKASLSEQEVEPSVINAQRLWNAFKPASDLESLYRQGYDLTKAYISDADKMAGHYYKEDDDDENV